MSGRVTSFMEVGEPIDGPLLLVAILPSHHKQAQAGTFALRTLEIAPSSLDVKETSAGVCAPTEAGYCQGD